MATPVQSDLDFLGVSNVLGLDATEIRKGIGEIATQAETDAGADDTRFITPLKLQGRLSGLGVVPEATPVYVSPQPPANVVLNAAEQVILTGAITLPVGSSGRISIAYKIGLQLGAALLGTNISEFRVYVDGVNVPGATTRAGLSTTLAVTLSLDAMSLASTDLVTGLASGARTVEVRGIRTNTASTATVVGQRSLFLRSA